MGGAGGAAPPREGNHRAHFTWRDDLGEHRVGFHGLDAGLDVGDIAPTLAEVFEHPGDHPADDHLLDFREFTRLGERIAVAAEGETAEASVSSQSARSPYFLLFDDRGVLVEAVANPFREVQRGAGPQVADFLAAKGLRIIIAGEFGPRMINALQGRQMEFRTAAGSAADAAAAAAEQ